MKRPAVFFDRDNTLIVSDGYLGDPARVVLMEGAPNAVAKARQYGFKIVTISNQSGVARGMFSEQDVQAVNTRVDELLRASNPSATIHLHLYCPFHPEASVEAYRQDSPLRKPSPGMLLEAAEKLNLDLARSWVVGDAPRDIEAGKAAGCRTILFRPPVEKTSPDATAPSEAVADFEATSLKEAVEIIAREAFRRPVAATPVAVAAPSAAIAPATASEVAADAEELSEDDCDLPPLPEPPKPRPAPPQRANGQPRPVPAAERELEPEDPPVASSASRLEALMEEILHELKKRDRNDQGDFSVSKLMAGIVQILALGTLFLSYLNHGSASMQTYLELSIFLETLTIALLIMGRQR